MIHLPPAEAASGSTSTGVEASSEGLTVDSGSPGSTTGEACALAETPEDWWDPAWRRRRLLRIDTSAFSEPLANFPLLLRTSVDELGPSWSERHGADLRFRASDQAIPIAHDVDDEVGGELALWLLVPELDPSAGSTSVWLYYDNPEAQAGTEPEDVWSGFISVHHLGSDLQDSAGAHHGSSQWEPVTCDTDCGPRIGLARSFEPNLLHEVVLDGHQSYDLGSDPYAATLSFSISLWMRSSSFTDHPWGAMVAKGESTFRVHSTDFFDPLLDERVAFAFDCGQASCLDLADPLGNYNLIASSTEVDVVVDDGAWHHVVGTFEAIDRPEFPPPDYVPDVQARIYVDGVEVAASPVLPEFLVPEDDQPVRFGHNVNTAHRWRGDLDEIRIAAGARTAAEIAADHTTVVDETLVDVGEEQAWCR